MVPITESLIKEIADEHHEVGLLAERISAPELEKIKKETEKILGKQIRGIRACENQYPSSTLLSLGFTYLSIKTENHFTFPFQRFERKAPFTEDSGLTIFYESISPFSQIPYSSITFQLLPLPFYERMVIETINRDDFVLVYINLHQFTDYSKIYGRVPIIDSIGSGQKLHDKLGRFLDWINETQTATARMKDYTV